MLSMLFTEGTGPPTPHYNSCLLGDLLPRAHLQFLSAVSSQCPAFSDGVALLKVWLRQRDLAEAGDFHWPVNLFERAFFLSVDFCKDPDTVYLWFFTVQQGTGCFNGFLASMLLAYLLSTHRISNTMTAYQLLRNSLNFLGKRSLNILDEVLNLK